MISGSARNWIAVNAVQQSNLQQKMKTKNTTAPHLIKSMDRSSSRLALLLIPLVSACFALSPMLQAQGQNTNTHFGDEALGSKPTGDDKNTAIGFKAMHDNRAGSENTATGFQALSNNTAGEFNTPPVLKRSGKTPTETSTGHRC
jgi:hypothetical protein